MNIANFLTKDEQAQIVTAIEAAEMVTTGEIRVHIESHCKGNVLERAAFLFHQLNMENTKERNGVLIYIAFYSRHFAIFGDTGITAHLSVDMWKGITDQIHTSFAKKDFCGGICRAIFSVGNQLAKIFPYKAGDTNELPNDISFGDCRGE